MAILNDTSYLFRELLDRTTLAYLNGMQDGAYTVKGSISTSASLNNVWTVLTDYPRLADVFSNILSSGVASSNDDTILHQVSIIYYKQRNCNFLL